VYGGRGRISKFAVERQAPPAVRQKQGPPKCSPILLAAVYLTISSPLHISLLIFTFIIFPLVNHPCYSAASATLPSSSPLDPVAATAMAAASAFKHRITKPELPFGEHEVYIILISCRVPSYLVQFHPGHVYILNLGACGLPLDQ
jgi:hypothetical protein